MIRLYDNLHNAIAAARTFSSRELTTYVVSKAETIIEEDNSFEWSYYVEPLLEFPNRLPVVCVIFDRMTTLGVAAETKPERELIRMSPLCFSVQPDYLSQPE